MKPGQRHAFCRHLLAAAALACAAFTTATGQAPPHTHVVIVVDGLRPDYVTPELMPRLAALGRRGIVFTSHHSVFPTVTRVNASSMVTGVYPEGHGILGNTIYVPAVSATRGLDTGNYENLEAVARSAGPLLSAPSLGEILRRNGKQLMAIGSGSSGAVFLLNHAGGAIAHQDFSRPPALGSRLSQKLGSPPAHATPNAALNRRAFDAYLTLGLDELHPDVTLMWISDPDTTAHAKGIGSAPTREALKLVDAEIGRLEDTLRARSLLDRTNLIVASDHGFSTHTGTLKLDALVRPFARTMADGSPDIVVAEGAIYLRGGADAARVSAIVAALQRRPEVGAIFTRPRAQGGSEGVVPGTLSFDVARWNHARAGDILVASNWTRDANDAGYAGTSTQTGVAGHGTSSPFDVHATLIAAGPDFREHAVSDAPTGNVDLTPTLLRLLGINAPSPMTGRVIDEGLRSGRAAPPRIERTTETVKTPDGSYTLTAHISTVGGHRYLDFTDVMRR